MYIGKQISRLIRLIRLKDESMHKGTPVEASVQQAALSCSQEPQGKSVYQESWFGSFPVSRALPLAAKD